MYTITKFSDIPDLIEDTNKHFIFKSIYLSSKALLSTIIHCTFVKIKDIANLSSFDSIADNSCEATNIVVSIILIPIAAFNRTSLRISS